MSIKEALFHAEQSSDLSELSEGVGDVDFLRAAGMVAQHYGTALSVWRLIELGDNTQLRPAFAGLLAACVRMGIVHNAHEIVSNVLSWMAAPICPACEGRGFESIPGTPHLSERACSECDGTGKKNPYFDDAEHRLHDWIVQQQGSAAREIAFKMRG
jgi:hypothetical protein